MGIDALAGIEGVRWDAGHPLVAELEDLLYEDFPRDRAPAGDWYASELGGWVWVHGPCRFFGPDTPSGYWPTIRRWLGILRAMYPDARITYGGDTVDHVSDNSDLTDAVLAACDKAWVEAKVVWERAVGAVENGKLIDVSRVSLRDMITSDDSNIAACVQRLVRNLDDPDGVISAFSNFAS